jgi:Domain of unknown function (DUF4956)
LGAIVLLAYAVYFRRYHRRDLLLAYVALNVGVLAVTVLLAGAQAGIGLGLGLFGILSIIRLRSDQITQEEVAYYFVALALGLVNGLRTAPAGLPRHPAVLVAIMYAIDHPRLGGRTYRQLVTLDAAYPDRAELHRALQRLLAAEVRHVVVLELDLVRDVTVVDVRFRTPRPRCELPVDTARRQERVGSCGTSWKVHTGSRWVTPCPDCHQAAWPSAPTARHTPSRTSATPQAGCWSSPRPRDRSDSSSRPPSCCQAHWLQRCWPPSCTPTGPSMPAHRSRLPIHSKGPACLPPTVVRAATTPAR